MAEMYVLKGRGFSGIFGDSFLCKRMPLVSTALHWQSTPDEDAMDCHDRHGNPKDVTGETLVQGWLAAFFTIAFTFGASWWWLCLLQFRDAPDHGVTVAYVWRAAEIQKAILGKYRDCKCKSRAEKPWVLALDKSILERNCLRCWATGRTNPKIRKYIWYRALLLGLQVRSRTAWFAWHT